MPPQLRTLKTLSLLVVAIWLGTVGVQAASKYASDVIQTNWDQAEHLQPNFWGPLSTARDGQQEPYKEAPGGQRLVQYFDKARMEQFDPKARVTTGLLTVELKSGNVQLGDGTFEQRTPAAVFMAGDPRVIPHLRRPEQTERALRQRALDAERVRLHERPQLPLPHER